MSIIITNEGNKLLQDAILGNEKITFTKMELLADPERSPGDMSYTVDISSVEAKGEGTVVIRALAKNDGFEDAYYFSVINIYAGDVIFASDENCNIYMPPAEIKTLHALDVYLKIDSINTELKVEYGSYVLKDEFERLNKFARMAEAAQGKQYDGKDLTEAFADEISGYSDAWAWIKDRIVNNNFTGIYTADYIPLTINEENVEMQIAGIDAYYGTSGRGHHIDFISRSCLSTEAKWNLTADNNGNEESPYPFPASNVHAILNGTVYNSLPQEVKNVISIKEMLIERRREEGEKLTSSTAAFMEEMGNVWLPTEFEVFGEEIEGTKGISAGQRVQYPIFENIFKNRRKDKDWWLATVADGNSTHAIKVSSNGIPVGYSTSNEAYVPLCFRIEAD